LLLSDCIEHKEIDRLNFDNRIVNPSEIHAEAGESDPTFALPLSFSRSRKKAAELQLSVAVDYNTTAIMTEVPVISDAALTSRYFGSQSRCLICGNNQHSSSDCSAKGCEHCGTTGHFISACPSHILCTKCREIGHKAIDCPEKLKKSLTADGVVCSLCSKPNHTEEACPSVWTTFQPDDSPSTNPIHPSCYVCASSSHWGDDCTMKSRVFNPPTKPRRDPHPMQHALEDEEEEEFTFLHASQKPADSKSIRMKIGPNNPPSYGNNGLSPDYSPPSHITSFDERGFPEGSNYGNGSAQQGSDSYRPQYSDRGPSNNYDRPSQSNSHQNQRRDQHDARHSPPPLPNEPLPPTFRNGRGNQGGSRPRRYRGGRGRR
jgi:protein AIR1/2